MGVDTKLTMEEYKELEKKFILHCEADPKSTDYSLYVDNKKKLTFGIGFNIEDNPNWLAIALLYKFSGLKPIEEINTIGYKKDVLLYGNGKYNKFIEENCKGISADNKVLQIMRKYKTAKNTKVKNIDKLSKEIQKLIDEYNKRSDIEKIPVNVFSFEFTDEEISLIYDIGKKEYENQLAQHLTGTGKPFNIHSIKDTKLYISLLSFTYQQGGGNLQEHSNIFQGVAKSRFLIWFTLRYNVLSFTRQYKRRLHESTLFGLIENQAVDTKKADIPATILDVFSYLNFFMAGGDNTYLSFIKTNDRCETMDIKAVDDGLVLFNKQPRYDVIKSSLQTEDFIKDFFSDESYFEGKFLKDSFPDDENPKGRTLKGIIDFASHSTIFSIFTRFIEESFVKEIKNIKGSEELFLLENIYVIDCINKNDFKLLLEQKYSGLQERCNVLIFLNSTSDIVNDISYLQAKCPNVYFTIAIQEGYTYSFRLDEKSSTQTNIILYKIKDGKYIPELIKETFKAENISNEENQDEKNILLFSAENSKNLSGRLSNNANIFHITHKSEDDIISKIKLYNMISDKYEGNIQIDMQGKEYDVSADKSSGYLTLDITLNVLDEVLNDEDINDIPYYMYVNDTGEIFESKISNGKVSFRYCPTASCKNQKVLFAFDMADFACKKSVNGKCLDYAFINKSSRNIKKTERTFTINKEDVPQYSITGVELDNIEEIASSNLDVLLNIEYRFKAYSDIEDKSKIKWGYMLLNNSELKSLSNITVLKPSVKLYEKFHQLTETGDMISIIPNKILSKDEIKLLKNDNYALIPIPYFNIHYIDIRNFNSNINNIKIVNETIESDIISLNFYIVVDNIGKNGFLVRYTYKTVEDAIKYHRHGELVGIKADLKVFPEKYGLYAVSPEAGNSIVSHVRGSTKNSQYVSASTLSDGAERFNVNNGSKKLSIDINKLKQSGAQLISTEEISNAINDENKALMSKKKVNIHQVIRNNEARFKAIQDQEVLIKGADRKSSQFIFTPDDLSKVKNIQKVGQKLLPLAYILTTVNLINAGIDSAKTQSIKPIAEEVAEQVAGWGGAFAGMWLGLKIGSLTGSIGIPGVGTVIGGIVGSIAGGYAGYFGISNFFEDDSDED